MAGESVVACEPIIGYLHRGVEKIVESKGFMSIIPYLDRLDYLSPAIQEHAYVMAIEKLLDVNVPERATLIRTIFDELTRISSHIMSIGSMTFDLGCLSLFLYGMEEREKIMSIFQKTTGSRMHIAYYTPGGVVNDIHESAVDEIRGFIGGFIGGIGFYMDAVEKLALNNRIFKERTIGVGKIKAEEAVKNGLSGVNLRASGVDYDIRKAAPYGAYEMLDFKTITLRDGDCYARMHLRVLEIKQSIELIEQCIAMLQPGEVCNSSCAKLLSKGLPKNTIIYTSTETPRGEFGVHMVIGSDRHKVHRMHFKSPSFAHVQFLEKLLVGVKIPDITAILGSIDFIMGCCDR
jgi:NADH:ubiquinone oxidoreductase subunit D